MRRLAAALAALALASCALGPPPARSGIPREREEAALEAVLRETMGRYDARGGYCIAIARGPREHPLDPSDTLLARFADRGDVHGTTWCLNHAGPLVTLKPIRWIDPATVEVGVAVRELARGRVATCRGRALLRDGRWHASCETP